MLWPNGSGSVVRGRGPDFARSTVLGLGALIIVGGAWATDRWAVNTYLSSGECNTCRHDAAAVVGIDLSDGEVQQQTTKTL